MLKRKAKRIPVKNGPNSKPGPVRQKGFGIELPPHRRLVEIYFEQKECGGQAGLIREFKYG